MSDRDAGGRGGSEGQVFVRVMDSAEGRKGEREGGKKNGRIQEEGYMLRRIGSRGVRRVHQGFGAGRWGASSSEGECGGRMRSGESCETLFEICAERVQVGLDYMS